MRLVRGYLLRLARLRLGYMGLVWGRVLQLAHPILGLSCRIFFIYFPNISLVREKPVPASQQTPAFHML